MANDKITLYVIGESLEDAAGSPVYDTLESAEEAAEENASGEVYHVTATIDWATLGLEYVPGVKERLEYLRGEINAERISWHEIAELESLAEHIEPGDVQLLEWAGVPEFPETDGPVA